MCAVHSEIHRTRRYNLMVIPGLTLKPKIQSRSEKKLTVHFMLQCGFRSLRKGLICWRFMCTKNKISYHPQITLMSNVGGAHWVQAKQRIFAPVCKIQGAENANTYTEHRQFDISSQKAIAVTVIATSFNTFERQVPSACRWLLLFGGNHRMSAKQS